jgi:hypothetical protein
VRLNTFSRDSAMLMLRETNHQRKSQRSQTLAILDC